MSPATATGASTPSDIGQAARVPSDVLVLGWAVAAGACVALVFAPTVATIVEQWSTSDTFAHGWFVLPLSIWLGWRRRDRLRRDRPYRPDVRWLLPVLACGIVWLLSRAAGVAVAEQAALVGLLISTLAYVLGRGLVREFRFALVMLVFLAPVGAELVPALMELTADLTVGAVRLSGIPIYREGLYFSIPSGDWSVVEACSGIRYLIASIMLGTLYSGLYLHGALHRAAFLALSAFVPLAANAVRAYGIVMLGHFSDNRLATGADHLLYGWLFFGIVMFCLFAIGGRFPQRDLRPERDEPPSAESPDVGGTRRRPRRTLALTVAGATLAAAAFPAWAGIMTLAESRRLEATSERTWLPEGFVPADAAGVSPGGADRGSAWAPRYTGFDALQTATRGPLEAAVTARAYVYAEQRQGKELISSTNKLVAPRDSDWREIDSDSVEIDERAARGPSAVLQVSESTLEGPHGRLLVWRWNAVRGRHLSDPVRGKLQELAARLALDPRPSVGYVLSIDADAPAARRALREASVEIATLPQLN